MKLQISRHILEKNTQISNFTEEQKPTLLQPNRT